MVANVGDAEQTGVEFDLLAVPSEGLDLGLSVAWVDAKTSEDFVVSEVVPKGTKLPNVPEWKLSSFAQYTWPVNMAGGSDLYGRLQWTWQDDSRNQLENYVAEERVSARGTFIQPSYSILDFKLGMATDNWTLEAFVSNLTDERAVLYNDDLYFDPFWGRRRITVNRPREYGVRFSYSWN
jgi:outer membrane receptor protein involved in Fe transport